MLPIHSHQKDRRSFLKCMATGLFLPSFEIFVPTAKANPAIVLTGHEKLTGHEALISPAPGGLITNGLISFLRLDENAGGVGTTCADSSGSGHTGTLAATTGAPTWVTGKVNSALSFNATNIQYVDLSNFADALSTFSACCWVNFATTTIINSLLTKFGTGGFASGQGWGLYTSGTVSGGLTSIVQDSGGAHWKQKNSSGGFNDSNWHHLCLTFDNSGPTLLQYVDGVLNQTDVSSGVLGSYSNANNVRIGNNYSQSATCSIDEARVYNRVLTSGEVSSIFNLTG